MTVVFDASFLIPLLDENARIDVPEAHKKVNYLVAELHEAREVIVVPTPALSEFLTGAGLAGPKYLKILTSSAPFRVAGFDTLAAAEAAAHTAEVVKAGKALVVNPENKWQKVKVDLQIIAIARVQGAERIYTDDPHFKKLVGDSGPQIVDFADLPLPPDEPQLMIDFTAPDDDDASKD